MNKDKLLARNHCLKNFSEEKQGIVTKIRSYLYEKYEIWDFMDLFPYRWRMYYWDNIKPIFKPRNQRIRKSIPRTWKDISHLMVDVNFEFIKAFYEDEYCKDIVDWEATESHKEFAEWLELTYKWITQRRPQLQLDLENAYPPCKPIDEMFEPIEDENGRKMFKMVDDDIPYEVKYAEVNRIEELIDNKDTEILTEFVKRREYFWT
jgi:hypothetical protein